MKTVDAAAIRRELVDELQQIVGCPREYFTVEVGNTIFISDEGEHPPCLFVQVNWFERGQEVQDRVARAIDKHIRQQGYEQVEIYFMVLQENKYYENGEHY
jgi:hypothetical protein